MGQHHPRARGTGDKGSPSVIFGPPQCQGTRPRARGLGLDAAILPSMPGSAGAAGLCLSSTAQLRGGSSWAPPGSMGANGWLMWKTITRQDFSINN